MPAHNSEHTPIPVFAINLKQRVDRYESITKEFDDKPEFHLEVIEAIAHELKTISLWQTIKRIVRNNLQSTSEFILICEDDHQFTSHYNVHNLFQHIEQAKVNNADVLCGGISWCKKGIKVSNSLFWIESFTGLQFTIIFRKFFPIILSSHFGEHDVADHKISILTDKKFVIHPFISIQKEFGYSDVTSANNNTGRVEKLFQNTSEQLELLSKAGDFYFKH